MIFAKIIKNNYTIEKYKFNKRFLHNIDFIYTCEQTIVILLYCSRYIFISTWQQLGTLLVRKKNRDYSICLRVCVIDCSRWITFRTQLCVLSGLSKEFTRLRKREIEKRIRDASGVVTFREISIRLIKRRLTRLFLSSEFDEKRKIRCLYEFHYRNLLLYTGIDLKIRWIINSKVYAIDKNII